MTRRLVSSLSIASLIAQALVAETGLGAQSAIVADTTKRVATTARPASVSAIAVRAAQPPVLDGRDTDGVWRQAPAITEFEVFDPSEGGTPRFKTEARVAFDDKHFYAFVRMFDPRPDSIVSLLSRRDVRTQSDHIKLIIDSYHDRRTGYEFAVNPAGVKRDYYIYNDVQEDQGWDGIWEVATSIDSLGWTAEYKIPLSQLRFANLQTHTFGFGIWRDVARHNERYSWPLYRNTKFGIASQLGEISGITGVGTPRRLEVSPYTVAKNETKRSVPAPNEIEYGRKGGLSVGADIKYGLSSNFTLDATVNPDFGQVEADPAVLNLGAFETFFMEQRPFFLEGSGIFSFSLGGGGDGGMEGLFYSRRIGRDPQLAHLYGDESTPTNSTILGAAKLTGRMGSGMSVGLLNAVTQREVGARDGQGRLQTVEPQSNYTVGRLQQDFRNGSSGFGLMLTGVNRNLDEFSDKYLRRGAYSAGADYRHRFFSNNYQVSGYTAMSRVDGSAEAIDSTQRSPVHFFQRPDDGIDLDPTRTSLSGWAQQVSVGKVGGGFLRWNSTVGYVSPGFEINDVGFLMQADARTWSNWVGLQSNKPNAYWRRANINFNNFNQWTTHKLLIDRMFNTNVHMQLKNSWWVFGGVTKGQIAGSFCSNRCTRGGPALRESPRHQIWAGTEGDSRYKVVPSLFVVRVRDDYGRSRFFAVEPSVEMRVASNFSMSLGPNIASNVDDSQFYGLLGPAGSQVYTFARLEQRTISMRTRLNFTATPTLSLQVYAQPYLSKGTFSNVRELNDPRAKDYDARFKPYSDAAVTADPGGLDFKQFRSNSVLRWEYRPGSSIYLVWAQGRSHFDDTAGSLGAYDMFRGDTRQLFRLHPDNTFLIKASYWFSL